MNEFDKQRVENAIWVLQQYKNELDDLAVEGKFEYLNDYDVREIFDRLEEIQKYLEK